MDLSSSKRLALILAIVGGVLLWNYHREPDHPPIQETTTPMPSAAAPPPPPPVNIPPTKTAEIPVQPPSPAPAIAAVPPLPANPARRAAQVLPGSVEESPAGEGNVAEDLDAVGATIRAFQTVHGENPIGSNAEITGALLGNNLKQIKLEVPTGSQVNGAGEMCDRWGTPYFFHQLSKTEMEIRSAGPDRQMWTGDDSQM